MNESFKGGFEKNAGVEYGFQAYRIPVKKMHKLVEKGDVLGNSSDPKDWEKMWNEGLDEYSHRQVKHPDPANGGKLLAHLLGSQGQAPYDDQSNYSDVPMTLLNRGEALKAIAHMKTRIKTEDIRDLASFSNASDVEKRRRQWVSEQKKLPFFKRLFSSALFTETPVGVVDEDLAQSYQKNVDDFISSATKHIQNKKNKSFRMAWQ